MPTAAIPAGEEAAGARSPLTGRLGPALAVFAVMAGIFSIVTTEIMPIGLLTPMGRSFQISEGTAGWMMTIPGIVAAIAAPLVTVATGRIDRRAMLCALMALLAVADFLAAAAPNYAVMLSSRILVGLTIGGFWSIGAGLAVRLVREESVARATAVIFTGVPLGSVLGVPAGTFLGHVVGWRASFAVMGALTVGVLIALLVLLPPLPPLPAVHRTTPRVLRDLFRISQIRIGLAAIFLVVIAHFATYTYVDPFLRQVTGVPSAAIGVLLLAYGAAGLAGNLLAGSMLTRSLRGTFICSASLLAGAAWLLPAAGRWQVGAVGLLLLWGLAYGAVPVCAQTWLARSAPHAPEAATVLFTSSFQAAISLGALLGGVVVDSASLSAVMLWGGTLAAAAVLVLRLLGGPGGLGGRSD
ncbi:MFS transporter [Streptomyces sp. N2-109]|uniref:MFS transporter n=1 Tax=Streptomyces gossypii TaxID=2883101 RepID=A0ABT2JY35_9ACTN|nr:MFS transporter [Streptomyces gossypii]MCT2592756.1 MFS transporter [Streptomyces gossypii]